MADIHGRLDKYLAMLNLIKFTDNDILFVIGDAIDRGPDGVDVLLDIMSRKNVTMILGNHEDMLLSTMGPFVVFGARKLWQNNGGSKTRNDLIYCRDSKTRTDIIRFLMRCPDYFEVTVNDRTYHLVHGFPGDTQQVRLWQRPRANQEAPFPDKITIVGHTPTLNYMEDKMENMSIWHGDGIIDIDCGCGHDDPRARLACLRLDDMQEFYV